MKYILAFLLLASTASAATITVPSLEVRNTESEIAIPIYISTDQGDRVVGVNLYAQICRLVPLGLNLIDGTIFQDNHGEDWELLESDIASNSLLTNEGNVLANGLLATVRVSTLGAVRGVHPIRLHGIQANDMTLDSDLVNLQPTFNDGYLTVFGPPYVTWNGAWSGEPSTDATVFVTADLSIEQLNVDALVIRSVASVPEPNAAAWTLYLMVLYGTARKAAKAGR